MKSWGAMAHPTPPLQSRPCSESRGQAVCDERELFTGSTALKLVDAPNKLPLKLSLSYQGLSTF